MSDDRTAQTPGDSHDKASEALLAEVIPRLEAADTALHNGDVDLRMAAWSRRDPVTLFGAAATTRGWPEIARVFNALAASFSDCRSFRYEVLAAGSSGDLAYVVGLEHAACSIDGRATEYSLRVTTVLRREDGEWKVVHRHGDRPPDVNALARLGQVVTGDN